MPQNEIKSELSSVYVHAVASMAGCACNRAERQTDNLGIDLTIRFRGDFPNLPSPARLVTFDVQLKSGSNISFDNQNSIVLDGLDKKNYDDYRDDRRNPPIFLILFVLPENSDEWLKLTEEELVLKKCAYWVSLRGAAECTTATKRVFFPKKQLFNVAQLQNIILPTLAAEEEFLYQYS
jgi:hypothetical protein